MNELSILMKMYPNYIIVKDRDFIDKFEYIVVIDVKLTTGFIPMRFYCDALPELYIFEVYDECKINGWPNIEGAFTWAGEIFDGSNEIESIIICGTPANLAKMKLKYM